VQSFEFMMWLTYIYFPVAWNLSRFGANRNCEYNDKLNISLVVLGQCSCYFSFMYFTDNICQVEALRPDHYNAWGEQNIGSGYVCNINGIASSSDIKPLEWPTQ
jgi:hypothetical protein